MDDCTFGELTLEQVLAYRKVALAVVGMHLGMSDEYVTSVLEDRMDEYIESQESAREILRETNFRRYLELISKECVIRYAATAAEGLAASPESDMAMYRVMGDTGVLGLTDDINAIARVEQILEPVVPDGFSEDEGDILVGAMRGMCDFYNAVAYRLVQVELVNIIVEATERLLLTGELPIEEVRGLLIERQYTATYTP